MTWHSSPPVLSATSLEYRVALLSVFPLSARDECRVRAARPVQALSLCKLAVYEYDVSFCTRIPPGFTFHRDRCPWGLNIRRGLIMSKTCYRWLTSVLTSFEVHIHATLYASLSRDPRIYSANNKPLTSKDRPETMKATRNIPEMAILISERTESMDNLCLDYSVKSNVAEHSAIHSVTGCLLEISLLSSSEQPAGIWSSNIHHHF